MFTFVSQEYLCITLSVMDSFIDIDSTRLTRDQNQSYWHVNCELINSLQLQ